MSETKPKRQLAGAFDLLPKSYKLVKDNLNVFVLIYSVPAVFALWSFLNWFTDDKTTWVDDKFSPTSWFGSVSGLNVETPAGISVGLALLFAAIVLVFALMQVMLTLRVSLHGRVEFHEIWNDFKRKGFKLLLLEIVMGIFILVGFLALIVPGVILMWRFFLAPYILLDRNTGIEEALRRSWKMTKGYFTPIFAVILVGLLFSLTGIIPYIGVIISFLLGVAYSCAPALRYKELR